MTSRRTGQLKSQHGFRGVPEVPSLDEQQLAIEWARRVAVIFFNQRCSLSSSFIVPVMVLFPYTYCQQKVISKSLKYITQSWQEKYMVVQQRSRRGGIGVTYFKKTLYACIQSSNHILLSWKKCHYKNISEYHDFLTFMNLYSRTRIS